MNFSRNEKWTTSWLNEMVSSPKFAKDLTSIYADDIIQAVDEDKAFPTISAAIDDLKTRTGLGEDQAIELRKVAAYTIDPKLYNAIENLETLEEPKLAKLLAAYASKCVDCTKSGVECGHILGATAKRAIKEYGIEKLSERVAAFNKKASQEENKKKWANFQKKASEEMCTIDHEHTAECKIEKDEKKDAAAKPSKTAWFQGSDESVDKIVSNDPNKLGYPKDVEYDRKPMAVPVGGDSRDWEQSWFEGAAAVTKKVMGPAGSELKEKEHWQRTADGSVEKTAAWTNFMSKQGKGMNEGFKKYLDEQKAKKDGDKKPADETSKKEDSKEDKKAAWNNYMSKQGKGMNEGFRKYLDEQKAKKSDSKPAEETDKKEDAKEEKASASACSIKKAELVFPQEVYSALQQMTGSKEQIFSQLKAMVDAIGKDEYAGAEEREGEAALPGIKSTIGNDIAAQWLVDNITSQEALAQLEQALQRLQNHTSNWKIQVKKAALKQYANLLKAADIAPNDINELTDKAGDKLSEVAGVLEDFKNSRQRLAPGEDQFVGEMSTEYTNRLNAIINDRGLASRIIDTIAKSADKATSLLYIISDLLEYEKQ